eukprot:4495702-Pyramimonas_sp.AAC.1
MLCALKISERRGAGRCERGGPSKRQRILQGGQLRDYGGRRSGGDCGAPCGGIKREGRGRGLIWGPGGRQRALCRSLGCAQPTGEARDLAGLRSAGGSRA